MQFKMCRDLPSLQILRRSEEHPGGLEKYWPFFVKKRLDFTILS